jgi:hypothetical protein
VAAVAVAAEAVGHDHDGHDETTGSVLFDRNKKNAIILRTAIRSSPFIDCLPVPFCLKAMRSPTFVHRSLLPPSTSIMVDLILTRTIQLCCSIYFNNRVLFWIYLESIRFANCSFNQLDAM